MKLSKGWSAYIFPKNNLRYPSMIDNLSASLLHGIMKKIHIPI